MSTTTTLPNQASSYSSNMPYDIIHYYTVEIFEKNGDPRVSNYHLMRTPWPTVFLTIIYYWFVRSIGPKIMRDKKPYPILPLIRTYNLLMACWNGWGFYVGTQLVNYGLDCMGCRPVDPNQRDEKTLLQIYYGYMFFTSRLVEFADTVFFILRKKESQATSFHVFHHSIVPTATWFFLKFAPGGNSAIFPMINTAIHTIMYSYYLLATYPSMKPFLGWKKYLTQMQIVQFFIIIAVCLQPLFIPGCKFPRALLVIMVLLSFVFIFLFVDFYLKSYNTSKRKQQQQKLDNIATKKQDSISVQDGVHKRITTGSSKEKEL